MAQQRSQDARALSGLALAASTVLDASRCAGRACGAPLTLETFASPAGLTARARPEARPEVRAANLCKPCLSTVVTGADRGTTRGMSRGVADMPAAAGRLGRREAWGSTPWKIPACRS